jgi:hypothetical protein
MTYNDLAKKYGVEVSDIRRAIIDFVQSEGCLNDGREANNTLEYLDMIFSNRPSVSHAPFDGGRGMGSMGQPID